MAIDQGPVVQSALLRGELVRLRREHSLTQEHVAADLEWSASKLIRIEGGRSSITKVDLDALLDKYGVTSAAERERLQSLNRGARGRAWWDDYRADLPAEYLRYVGYEAGASFIRAFQNTVVPGLLQTREYGQVVSGTFVEGAEADVSQPVNLRLRRQAELAKRTPPARQYFVLDEAVIRRHVGIATDPGIMPAQLREIAARAGEDRIAIRVIPFSAGAHPGLTSPFTMLEFEGLPDLLYFDTGRGNISLIFGDDSRVAEYADSFERLLNDALSSADSIEFILDVAEQMS